MHSRDPALLFPDKKKVPDKKKKHTNECLHVLPGSCDCKNQVEKNTCVFQRENANTATQCLGRTGAAGANVEKGRHFVAVKKLQDYQSTGKGRGHLSDLRAVHSDTVPFSAKNP
jgi:hypothetical protein